MFFTLILTTLAVAAPAKKAPRGVAGALRTAKRDRHVLRFFASHSWLLTDTRFSAEATRQVRLHRRSLRSAQRVIRIARRERAAARRAARRLGLAAERPAVTICRIFGPDCHEALQVARCESRFQTRAQNGQYLGLFQMGSTARPTARRLYGHGTSAEVQARAARRYFIASGRDWSPWSCRPR
jgi:hypothetical protein